MHNAKNVVVFHMISNFLYKNQKAIFDSVLNNLVSVPFYAVRRKESRWSLCIFEEHLKTHYGFERNAKLRSSHPFDQFCSLQQIQTYKRLDIKSALSVFIIGLSL